MPLILRKLQAADRVLPGKPTETGTDGLAASVALSGSRPRALDRAWSRSIFGGYFVIENVNVFEIDLTPDGAAGSSVTNAECSLTPTRAGMLGMWMAAWAWPFESMMPP